jgi:uncharacterized coiled-coil DUF342 family protein
MSTKDEYVQKMHAKLDQLNAEIDKLVLKADQDKDEARVEYHKQIEALRAAARHARELLEELRQSGEGAWQDMKAGVEAASDAIGAAMDSAKSRFK